MSKAEGSNKPVILETVVFRFEQDIACIYPKCPQNNIINSGDDALQSPSTSGFYYHLGCFKEMIRERGKDPDKFLKIVNIGNSSKN